MSGTITQVPAAPNPWANPGGGQASSSGTTQTGPSVASLLSSYRGLVAIAERVSAEARATRARLRTLASLGATDAGASPSVPTVRALEDKHDELAAELAQHAAQVRGLGTRYQARPSAAQAFDLDIVESTGLSGLGFLPILAGIAVVGRIAIVLGGMYLADRGLHAWETHRVAKLIEQGKDVSKLVQAMQPPPSTGSSIASVTTPIAIAAGAVALAYLVKEWKRG